MYQLKKQYRGENLKDSISEYEYNNTTYTNQKKYERVTSSSRDSSFTEDVVDIAGTMMMASFFSSDSSSSNDSSSSDSSSFDGYGGGDFGGGGSSDSW